ncbi:MAG: metalloregulator ArsR/SmtB family transcription factor [Candidatus Aegiribacteria sp.]|nr:metalloregulator ArsR/SmtB family transcription factor [Candidatus Aegiribacteria sp.]
MVFDKDRYQKRAEILRAMANAARLVIVERLSSGDRTVGELTEMVNLDISTVSRHLLILRNAGIVSSRRDGNKMIYNLRTPCVLNFINCVEQVIAHENEEQGDDSSCMDCS